MNKDGFLETMMLNDEQMAAYRRDGYVAVENLLTPGEVDAFLESERTRDTSASVYALHGHLHFPAWMALAVHPNVAGGAAQLAGGPVKIVQTMLLDKPPSGQGISLHQDTHYLPSEPNTLLACWIALSDTDPENGGLCVVPGTHTGPLRTAHQALDPKEHASWTQDYEMLAPDGRKWTETLYSFEIDDLSESDTVRLTVPKGGGVFFSGMVIHGSFANRSPDRPRTAFAVHYVHRDTWLFRADTHDALPVESP